MKQKSVFVMTLFFLSMSTAYAETDASPSLSLSTRVKKALAAQFNKAEIQCASLSEVEKSLLEKQFSEIRSVRLIEAKPNGVAILEVNGISLSDEKEASQVIQAPFEAWVNAPVAIHRIFPNAKLKEEDFKIQPINVATGQGREYRGVLASENTNFDQMESTQSILEGQFVVASAIRKQPDVRRGETVTLELISGDLSLTTQAVIQEPASIGERVRVLTVKTKKEMVGKVKENHSVEVNL